jgi:hypothetical protein
MTRRVIFLILVFVTGVAFAQTSAVVEVVNAEFGLFDVSSNPREPVFEPTLVVPHRQGQRYGWIIDVRTTRRTLSVREEYLLPNPSSTRKPAEPSYEILDIPQQRRNQVSQRQLVPVDGKIYGEWSIGPNEPAGHRHLQVVIEGQVAASFEYDVK